MLQPRCSNPGASEKQPSEPRSKRHGAQQRSRPNHADTARASGAEPVACSARTSRPMCHKAARSAAVSCGAHRSSTPSGVSCQHEAGDPHSGDPDSADPDSADPDSADLESEVWEGLVGRDAGRIQGAQLPPWVYACSKANRTHVGCWCRDTPSPFETCTARPGGQVRQAVNTGKAPSKPDHPTFSGAVHGHISGHCLGVFFLKSGELTCLKHARKPGRMGSLPASSTRLPGPGCSALRGAHRSRAMRERWCCLHSQP